MSLIHAGNIHVPAGLKEARGGTELMRDRLVSWLGSDLLEDVDIHVGGVYSHPSARCQIMWVHDMPKDVDPFRLKNFDAIVFVSQWQRDIFLAINPDLINTSYVIANTIPFEKTWVSHYEEDDTFRVVYHTTPHRGLDIAIDAFNLFHKKVPNSTFDVYSSFKVYGIEQKDADFKHLFDKIEQSPGIRRCPSLPNDAMMGALSRYHCFLYPSTWYETSCLSLMEALASGLVCIHTNLGALTETAGNMGLRVDMRTDRNELVQQSFLRLTEAHALVTTKAHRSEEQSGAFITSNGGKTRFINQWQSLLRSLKG